MNKPYVKQFDENGTLLNPINGSYKSVFPNRRKRREVNTFGSFKNNRGSKSLVVSEVTRGHFVKYEKFLQRVQNKDGSFKMIKHTVEKLNNNKNK